MLKNQAFNIKKGILEIDALIFKVKFEFKRLKLIFLNLRHKWRILKDYFIDIFNQIKYFNPLNRI